MLIRLIGLPLVLLALGCLASAAEGKRLALIIIGDDSHALPDAQQQRRKPVDDAGSVSDALNRDGFEVMRGWYREVADVGNAPEAGNSHGMGTQTIKPSEPVAVTPLSSLFKPRKVQTVRIRPDGSVDTEATSSNAAATMAKGVPASNDMLFPARTVTAAGVLDTRGFVLSQRAAVLVDAPDDPQKVKTYVGSVTWRAEKVGPGQGRPSAWAVRAEVVVPEAKLGLSMLLQKNFDQQLPASHTIELHFMMQPGNTLGGINKIGVPQLRNADARKGTALDGSAVMIADNYFLVGLVRGDVEITNSDLLNNRNWIDIPFYFASGKLAKITFEKGEAGRHIIADAIRSWQ
jgi:hypothetical protein